MKNFHLWKKDPTTNLFMNSLVNLPTPKSISFMWNMGFLLGMTLTLQIVTGLVLSMNYVAHTNMAFDSVIHIMRDLDSGWAMRYIHMNGASLFFILMYIHIARGLYFSSYLKTPMTWVSGVLIMLISMGTAFMGYVLPWGQMSFWGATVITSMISAIPYIGLNVTQWLWGNFSVSQPTLNRFFSLHFLLPLVIVVLVCMHLMFLHQTGSSNPTGVNPDLDKMKFFPFFLIKDMTPLIFILMLMFSLTSLNPNLLGDVENFNPSSMLTTPTHIQPEWYFLFAYAILRAVPSKLGGVLLMAAAILCLIPLIIKKSHKTLPMMNKKFLPTKKMIFWGLIASWLVLTWIGMKPVEEPFSAIGKYTSMLYFTLMFSI